MAAIVLYLMFCAYIVSIWAAPEALGTGSVRLGPDSATYYTLGEGLQSSSNKLPLLSLSSNLIGPIALVTLIYNPLWIAVFDATLFLIALWVVSTLKNVRFGVFLVLTLLNAELLSAITTVNKEIFALFAAVLFAKYLDQGRRSWTLLLLIVISAVMARWEQVAVIGLYFFFTKSRVFKNRPVQALLFVLFGISVIWPFIVRFLDTAALDHYTEGARTMAILNAIQAHFGYFLVAVPKIIMNLIGTGSSPFYWLGVWPSMDHSDVQNAFLIRIHEFMTTFVVVIAFLSKKLRLHSPLIFFCALYMVVTSANLFVQSRYDFPVYVLLCLEISKTRQMGLRSIPARRSIMLTQPQSSS